MPKEQLALDPRLQGVCGALTKIVLIRLEEELSKQGLIKEEREEIRVQSPLTVAGVQRFLGHAVNGVESALSGAEIIQSSPDLPLEIVSLIRQLEQGLGEPDITLGEDLIEAEFNGSQPLIEKISASFDGITPIQKLPDGTESTGLVIIHSPRIWGINEEELDVL